MPAHTLTPSIVLDRVSFSWPDGTTALSGVTGAFGAGRTGLVGRNGSGKSTLLRLIQGQMEADSGDINLMGRTRIGSVPQDPPGGDITVIDVRPMRSTRA
jgi:ATPase subunit of ABC transporter with duplicated ATPase domains